MKTKLIATVLLSVIGLLLVVGGTTHAQSPDDNYTVYLPFVSKPDCTYTVTSAQASLAAYVVASSPVVRIGDIVTVTGAIVNDGCRAIGRPYIGVALSPLGILSPTVEHRDPYDSVPGFGYELVQVPMLATGTGPVAMTLQMVYEPGPALIGVVRSDPTIIRVLSNP
jgi:hypothetical protein